MNVFSFIKSGSLLKHQRLSANSVHLHPLSSRTGLSYVSGRVGVQVRGTTCRARHAVSGFTREGFLLRSVRRSSWAPPSSSPASGDFHPAGPAFHSCAGVMHWRVGRELGEAGRGGGEVGRGVSGGGARHLITVAQRCLTPGVVDRDWPPGDASRRGSSACLRSTWSARPISRRPPSWATRRTTSSLGSVTSLISASGLPAHGRVRSSHFFRSFENFVQHCFVDFII